MLSPRHCPSPHHGERPPGARITLLVLHSISLPPGQYGGAQVEQLFAGTLDWDAHPYFQSIRGLRVSAHYFIRRCGELLQFVDCERRAWHAGASQWQGQPNCNDYSIGIELEGLEGGPFEPAQYQTLAALCHELAARYPLQHMAGGNVLVPGHVLQRLTGWPSERLVGLWREVPHAATAEQNLPGQVD